MTEREKVLNSVNVGEIENPVTLESVTEKLEQIDGNEQTDLLLERMDKIQVWLASMGLEVGDVMVDDEGREFVMVEEELGTASEQGYEIVKRKIILDEVI